MQSSFLSLHIVLIFLGLTISSSIAQQLEKSRSVWVEQGLVRGKIYKIHNQQLQIFRGIPYAEAPLGPLRFRRPVKKARWEREYSATEYGPPCIQFMDFHKVTDTPAAVLKQTLCRMTATQRRT